MAGILKKQITKHLSKFAKNFSPDKINISTLKGEGELHNLELNEEVLMDLMDLPLWITLTKAKCNRVSFKIPWTKLKTVPAHIHLDRVEVEMKVVQEFRTPTDHNPLHSSGGKYSLSDRVIDGLYVSVNEIAMDFKSHAFHASILMSQFTIRSTTPKWEYTNDLHNTRIRDKAAGELLNFKEAHCQTVRINIDALRNEKTTPILVITYDAKIRFAIKKRLEDCQVITSKLKVVLTDILLVLTDSQLKALVEFLQMMSGLNQKAQDLVKADTNILSQSKKIEQQAKSKNSPELERTAEERHFHDNDIIESGYHVSVERVDMHLVDEQHRNQEDTFKRRTDGGAMKINIRNLSLDFYPYHVYNTDRCHWENYDLLSDTMEKRDTWAKHLLANFRQQVKIAREQGRPYLQDLKTSQQNQVLRGQGSEVTRPRTSSELQQAARHNPRPQTIGYNRNMDVLQVNRPRSHSDLKPPHQPVKGHHQIMNPRRPKRQPKLMENCMVLRLEEFAIFAVSTEGSTDVNKKFFYCDKESFSLPPEMSSIHLEITSYYFPEGLEYPVPEANMYWEVNPIRLDVDYTTVLWLNQFVNLMATGVQSKSDSDSETSSTTGSSIGSDFDHVDIRIDALMPKITVPAETEVKGQPERPSGLQIQISQVTLSNCRIGTPSSISDLASAVQNIYSGKLFAGQQQFPNEPWDLSAVPQMLWNQAYRHEEADGKGGGGGGEGRSSPVAVQGKGIPKASPLPGERHKKEPVGKKAFFKSAVDDVWSVHCDQVWADFLGVESALGKPVPFIESIPIELWACFPPKETRDVLDNDVILKKGDLRSPEPSHSQKRKMFGHRKAASLSNPIGRSMSPPSGDINSEFSSSLTDLMSSQSAQRSLSGSLTGSQDFIMSQGDTRSLPLHTQNRTRGFTPPKIPHSHPGTPCGDMPASSKELEDSGVFQSSQSSCSLTSGVGMSSDAGSYPGLGSTASSHTSSIISDSAFGSISTSVPLIPSALKPGTYSVDSSDSSRDENIADRHMIVESKGKVRIILNRHQFLFLMRLVDSLVKMSEAIEEDIVMFQGKSDKVSSMVVAARLQAAELTLVLPALSTRADGTQEEDGEMETKPCNDDEEIGANNNSDATTNASDQHRTDNEFAGDSTVLNWSDETTDDSAVKSSPENSKDEETDSFKADCEFEFLGTEEELRDMKNDKMTAGETEHMKTGAESSHLETKERKNHTVGPTIEESIRSDEPTKGNSIVLPHEERPVSGDVSVKCETSASQTGLMSGNAVFRYKKGDDDDGDDDDIEFGEIAADCEATPGNQAFGDDPLMSNTFSSNPGNSSLSSPDSLVIESPAGSDATNHADAATKTGSMSNLYSADDELLAELESQTQDQSYRTLDAGTQTGCDEDEEQSTDGATSTDLVSIMNVQLSDLQAGVQLFGDKTGIKLTMGKVIPEEQGNVNYQEYLENRISESNRRRTDQLPALTKSETPVVRVRLSLGPAAEKYSHGATKHLGVQVDGLDAQVLMSSLTGLVGMIDDDESSGGSPMPIDVAVSQANFKLATSLTTKAEDVVEMPKLSTEHDKLHGESNLSEAPSEGAPSSVASSPLEERSISEVTTPSSESSAFVEENQQLREQLEMTRSALSTVELERASLLKSLVKLQDELIDVERERENMRQEVVRLKNLKRSSSTLSLK